MPTLTTVVMRLPVAPRQWAAADAVGEVAHPVEHPVHIRDDVVPTDGERRIGG